MNTDKTCLIESSSSEETMQIGERFGKKCRGGEVFLLASDLGGGKTTFTKGLAKGLGSKEIVGSPTFTVNRIYACRNDLYLHHFDFYRLSEGGMVAHELAEVIDDPKAVTVIEWGDIVTDTLPDRRVTITFDKVADGEENRCLNIQSPPELAYVYEEDER